MTANNNNLTPQEQLARVVREETDGGRRVVRFFMQVADGELDHEGFKPNHRMDSAKELVKIGLTEFEDYINSHLAPAKRRAPKSRRPSPDTQLSPEIEEAREELAKYARELTNDGRKVLTLYSQVMDGLRNDEGFKPHHRIAAGKELLIRGFGPVSAWSEPVIETQTQAEPQPEPAPAPAAEPQPQTHPTLVLTPAVSEYLSEAAKAYDEQSPFRQLLPQQVLDIVDGEEPLEECPCAKDEYEGREPYCPDKEGECPYYGIQWPEFTEEEMERMSEYARRGLRVRAELLDSANPSKDDP